MEKIWALGIVIAPQWATRGHTYPTDSQGESGTSSTSRPLCCGGYKTLLLPPLLSFLADVWEKEFDPIMVILRTVYRRDVQSAMDRYSAL